MRYIYHEKRRLSNVFFNFFVSAVCLAVTVFTRHTRKGLARIAEDFSLRSAGNGEFCFHG